MQLSDLNSYLASLPKPTDAPYSGAPSAQKPALPMSPATLDPMATTDPLAFGPQSGSGSMTAPAVPAPDAPPAPPASTLNPAQPPTLPMPPAPSPASSPTSGLPAGFTMGSPTSADYGSAYYNGQKIIGNSGGYWQLANGQQGPAYDPAVEKAITDAANQAYVGSAGNPGENYLSMVDPSNPYTSPEVRALLQNPEWQASYDTGPLYENQFSPDTQKLINAIPNLRTNLQLSGNAPAGAASFVGAAPGSPVPAGLSPSGSTAAPSGQRSIAPGAANDVGTPSQGLSQGLATMVSQMMQGGAPGGSPVAPGGSPAGGNAGGNGGGAGNGNVAPGVNGTPTTAENALTNMTLLPSNQIDRFKIANDALNNTIQNVLDPQFQANERDANRYNFGAGRGVSGIARTSQGDIVSDYNRQKANLSNTLLQNATTGSIDDLYRNLGLALQEQSFQAGQQGQAFNQNLELQRLADAEQQQSFGQALQQLLAGSSGDPSQIALVLSQIFGSQAGQAGQAASNYAASQQQVLSQQQQNQQMQDFLQSLFGSYGNDAINQILGQGIPGVQITPGSIQ